MLRESCGAAESLARDLPLALLLEDLRWGDPATVDLIGALAERAEPARLLLLASYRPVDAAMLEHPIAPLRRRLEQRGAASGLEALRSMPMAEVAESPGSEGPYRISPWWLGVAVAAALALSTPATFHLARRASPPLPG